MKSLEREEKQEGRMGGGGGKSHPRIAASGREFFVGEWSGGIKRPAQNSLAGLGYLQHKGAGFTRGE